MASFLGVLLAVVVALVAILFAFMQASHGEVPFDPPENMQHFQPTPAQMHNGTGYNFGRYSSPVPNPNFREMNLMEHTLQRKEWSFNAVSDGRFLLGFAAVDLGYVESGFLYIYDIRTGANDYFQFLLPGFVNGAKIAPSDIEDGACSKFTTYFSALHVEICYKAKMDGWRVDARGKTKRNCKIALQVDMLRSGGSEFAMNYPIGPDRAGYTHKTADLAVNGTLTFLPTNRVKAGHRDIKTLVNEPFIGSGLSDYTRSQSRRFTEWFWVALTLSTRDMNTGEIVRHGLQLSTNTVGTLESVVWINGRMFEVTSPLTVTFINVTSNQSTILHPGDKEIIPAPKTKYEIKSADGRIQLQFIPWGVLPNKITTPLAFGGFYHSYGLYTGKVAVSLGPNEEGPDPVLELDRPVAGIFEDHSVHW